MQPTQAPDAAGQKASDDNLSLEGLIGRLTTGEPQEEQPEAEDTAEETDDAEESPEAEDTAEEVDAEAEADSEEDAADEDSAEVDLLSLDPKQIQELAKKGKSRLLERVGELTAKNRAMQAQLEEIQQKQSSAPAVPHEQNPFKDLTTFEDIKAKHAEIERTLETTDRLLDEYEDYGPDDVIVVGNTEYTKKQIKIANRNAKDALTKYLPAQGQHLMKLESYKAANSQWQEAARKEIPEIQDEESSIGKAYKELVSDPLVQKLKQEMPELGVQIEYILAHAARSKFGGKAAVAKGAGKQLKVKPPAAPVGATAAKAKSGNSKYQEAMKRFYESGREEDWVAAQSFKS